jgi:HD-like signal output (HDOD) protein
MAGLIHEIGLIILALLRPHAVATLADSELDETSYLQAEMDLLGVDHAYASALVAKSWHLPEWLCLALRAPNAFRTNRRDGGDEALSALLALGSRCSEEAGLSLWAPRNDISRSALAEDLGLDEEVCTEVVAGLREAVLHRTSF